MSHLWTKVRLQECRPGGPYCIGMTAMLDAGVNNGRGMQHAAVSAGSVA